jgi:hypothetical protein
MREPRSPDMTGDIPGAFNFFIPFMPVNSSLNVGVFPSVPVHPALF